MSTQKPDSNWWLFSIDKDERTEKIPFSVDADTVEVNPELKDGRKLLHYSDYIGLDKLLGCQVPSSKIPDERVFIVTHQLIELVFKLMIFDLAVVAETFGHLLLLGEMDEPTFIRICADEDFWRPALTASGRIKYSSVEILPSIMKYLGNPQDETFSSIEFYYFRDNLAPGSGFQTAQFRLIQRAFGKSNLLSVRLFPGDAFRKNYEGAEDGPVAVVDPLVLRNDTDVATPPDDSPLSRVAQVDEMAHNVLSRIPALGANGRTPSPIRQLHPSELAHLEEKLKTYLSNRRVNQKEEGILPANASEKDDEALTIFRDDLQKAAAAENERRISLKRAREGAFYLRRGAPKSHLAEVLDRLVSADNALHGLGRNSLLKVHLEVASKRISEAKDHAREKGKPEPSSGTGGGGVQYLGYSLTFLIQLFPALIAYRDIKGEVE